MDSLILTSTTATIPAYVVNFTTESLPISAQFNLSRSPVSSESQTTGQSAAGSMAAAPIGRGGTGTWGVQSGVGSSASGVAGTAAGAAGEDEDVFGEHYFHICIYIWVFVVVSSLIALSVKWGCCVRSLTRWEVKKIPLRKFHKTEGDDSHDKCPICHESFHEGRLIRQLPCNHCYHSYCVDRWLVKMSNRCPLCKQRVSISLFCPWSKQRHNKKGSDVNGPAGQERFSLADLETEASVDESPPVPPLSTLTPSSWYGEDIMSGPSKFVIMRPGRATRIIDIREQNKSKTAAEACADVQIAGEEFCKDMGGRGSRSRGEDSCHSCGELQMDTGCCSSNASECRRSVSMLKTASDSACLSSPHNHHHHYHHHQIEQHQTSYDLIDELHKPSSRKSSRSCSVSSDQPLLASACPGCGDLQVKGCNDNERMGDGSSCLCQFERKTDTGSSNIGHCENGIISIPSATTNITAAPDFGGLSDAVRHVQVVSLHHHHSYPSFSAHRDEQGETNKESSLTQRDGCPQQQRSVPDETTVFLSSGSSSVLTCSGGTPDKTATPSSHRLSLPRHYLHKGGFLTKTNAEITSRSLNSLTSAWPSRGSPLISHTVIDPPITYLGQEQADEERLNTLREGNEAGCNAKSIPTAGCDKLYVSSVSPITTSDVLDGHKLPVEVELERLGTTCVLNDPDISSTSRSTPRLDSVLTTLPASNLLFAEHSSPLSQSRKTRRRSNDYTCKHL
ncbi:E3 ubiquitin-protein ligase rnf167-like [Plakobranchus ocellatus]|uniref:E3 ubiquitin-protein ligase rnf167-like n=1 Tax=Plakobranchus ocellatus TaxID=259542 RepID=A0AAV4CAE0_9GAST|nr:E3 ubiquitin-protein ligase rnf167-like [Plakobranchus ocellatus]